APQRFRRQRPRTVDGRERVESRHGYSHLLLLGAEQRCCAQQSRLSKVDVADHVSDPGYQFLLLLETLHVGHGAHGAYLQGGQLEVLDSQPRGRELRRCSYLSERSA